MVVLLPPCSPRSSEWSEAFGEVLAEDVLGGLGVGTFDLDLHVQAAGAQDGGVDHVLAVGGADDDHVLQAFHAVDLGEELGDDGVLHVRADAGSAGAEEGFHLVEEDDDGGAFGGLLACTLEDEADLSLGLADVLVEEFGALDVEEEALALGLSGDLGDLFGQRVGDGLGDECLAASGGP